MKVALLGSGKTGSKVQELHSNTIVFNSKTPPTIESLSSCDVVISFLPGDVFLEYIPLLIESQLPVVTGSTGFDWPKDIEQQLLSKKLVWVRAHNFSLGMNIVKSMIETLSKVTSLYEDSSFNIHDVHHTKKLDAPSGTAISWQQWLGQEATITSERIGDVIGYHHIEMKSQMETIKLTHEAKDRAMFASGALWVANKIINNTNITYGLNHFSDIVKEQLNI